MRLGNDLEARHSSQVTWSGGSLEDVLEASDSAVVTVVGQNFNYPYGPVPDLSGVLTGTLADGAPVSASFSTAAINLKSPHEAH